MDILSCWSKDGGIIIDFQTFSFYYDVTMTAQKNNQDVLHHNIVCNTHYLTLGLISVSNHNKTFIEEPLPFFEIRFYFPACFIINAFLVGLMFHCDSVISSGCYANQEFLITDSCHLWRNKQGKSVTD